MLRTAPSELVEPLQQRHIFRPQDSPAIIFVCMHFVFVIFVMVTVTSHEAWATQGATFLFLCVSTCVSFAAQLVR